jgi:hypothetical protein
MREPAGEISTCSSICSRRASSSVSISNNEHFSLIEVIVKSPVEVAVIKPAARYGPEIHILVGRSGDLNAKAVKGGVKLGHCGGVKVGQ